MEVLTATQRAQDPIPGSLELQRGSDGGAQALRRDRQPPTKLLASESRHRAGGRTVLPGRFGWHHRVRDAGGRDPDRQVRRDTKAQRVLEALRSIADERSVPVAHVAIAWTIQQPGITTAIVGARTAKQGASNARAAELSSDELAGIEHAFKEAMAAD